ncbi:Mu-like protein prophage I protein-like protein [Magnetococcus marinus MC-1]|uniref:Mu-like protein prophage I protein-like protein n=1 Tax=Magnetococcus marinus (strain ATCC BAA-1437 / JCM 17883 / MC-1) TaxID=156889 RepID=A0LC78_MAGMM|nr:phage protease [Magnetococcus marinus]ABK45571.1 Mu-like protein prophage I protein-like protein [Magnetococcus marinus MC-1]
MVQSQGDAVLVDYEHQSMHAEYNGQPAPAAGWIETLEYVAGQGLYATVRWTERAKEMIRAGEYRYISPAFNYDNRTGAVSSLISAALTNQRVVKILCEGSIFRLFFPPIGL